MKSISTYQELMNLDRDIIIQMSKSPAFLVFNREKIKNFQKNNQVRLKILNDSISNLMELYINKDEKGVYKQKIMPEGEANRWDFKSDEAADKFNKETELFLGKSIEIVL